MKIVFIFHVDRTDSDSLCKYKDVLIRRNFPLTECHGQVYDGASNMMGRLSRVATRLQKDEPTALAVHCFAHCLNLCLQDAVKICNCVICLA